MDKLSKDYSKLECLSPLFLGKFYKNKGMDYEFY